MVKIITDSSSNFTREEAAALNIGLLPLTISFGTEEYRDGVDITAEEFYVKMSQSRELPHTSQLTEEQIEAEVVAAIKDGAEVLLMPLASVLSGSYERCKAVADKYGNVYAYDTKCTTVMLKLCVTQAVQMAKEGATAAEIIKAMEELRPKLRIYACLDTLENLRKGGRLSGLTAVVGSMLKIKPVITFGLDGAVEMLSKQFGMNKGLGYISSLVNADKIDYTKPVYLIYTQNDKNAELLLAKTGIKHTEKCNICPVIGTHIGPDAAGIVFALK